MLQLCKSRMYVAKEVSRMNAENRFSLLLHIIDDDVACDAHHYSTDVIDTIDGA